MAARVVPGAATSKTKTKSKVGQAEVAAFDKKREEPAATVPSLAQGRPDKAAYDASMLEIEASISKLKAGLESLKLQLNSNASDNSIKEERKRLRNDLNDLKDAQAANKTSRGHTLDEMKRLQNKVQDKVKELNAAKNKFPYKNAQEIDTQIKHLEKQVESGSMKLVDERKALNEMVSLKKMRRTVDSFGSQQDAIEADRKAIEAIKAKLDDPEAKAAQDKFTAIKDQLDALNAKFDDVFKGRNKLYEERDALKKQMDEQWAKRRELQATHKAANDAYYAKITEERNKRIERQKAERQAQEEGKRKEINDRLLDEASAPAFEREIEDCKTLIDYFSRGGAKSASSPVPAPTLALSGEANPKLPALDIRKIDAALPEGATALVKKGGLGAEDEWLAGTGSKRGGKKGNKKAAKPAAAEGEEDTISTQSLQLPLSTLSALLQLEVVAPLSQSDIPATIEGLKVKQKWLEENQEKTTKDRIEAVKLKIARATDAVSNKPTAGVNGHAKKARRASAEVDQVVPKEASPAGLGAEVDETVADAEEPVSTNGEAEPLDLAEQKLVDESTATEQSEA